METILVANERPMDIQYYEQLHPTLLSSPQQIFVDEMQHWASSSHARIGHAARTPALRVKDLVQS